MIKGISHVVIFTTNMDKSIEFYGTTLGLNVTSTSKHWSEVKVPNSGTYLGLHSTEKEIDRTGTTEVSFLVDDIQKAQKWLEASKVNITREANEIAPGRWIVDFTDPDGNPLSVYATG